MKTHLKANYLLLKKKTDNTDQKKNINLIDLYILSILIADKTLNPLLKIKMKKYQF